MNDSEFLTYFETLASSSAPDSLVFSSCRDLLSTLVAIDHQKPSTSHSSPFGNDISQDLDYTLKRVVRSLTSSEIDLQLRFAFALKEILAKFPQIKSNSFLDHLVKECDLKKTVKKSEKTHFLIAKMLGIKALLGARKPDETLFGYAIEMLLGDISQHEDVQEFGLQITAESLKSTKKEELRMKIKVISQKYKGFFKPESHSHYVVVFAIARLSRQVLSTQDHAFRKPLEKHIGDYSNLIKLLIKSTEKFPQEPAFLSGIIDYIQDMGKESNVWSGFFSFLMEELVSKSELASNFDYKKAFILLSLFHRFLKRPEFSVENLRDLKVPGLTNLWVRNLGVQNETLKRLSLKIERRVTKIFRTCEKSLENRTILFDWVVHMKEKPIYRFLGSNEIARVFFSEVLDESFSERYWKFLKKSLISATDAVQKLFMLSEIQHFSQWRIDCLPEERVIEILFVVFKESNEDKILKIVSQSEEEKGEIDPASEGKKLREKVFDCYFSLLNLVIKRKSKGLEGKKGMIWKGLDEKRKPLLLSIAERCNQEPMDYFEKRRDFLSQTAAFLEALLPESQDYRKGLALVLLISAVTLISYQSPEEAFDSLSELIQAKNELFHLPGDKPAKKRKINDGSAKNEPKDVAVLIDLLVSLLTKAPNFLREVVRRTFREFVGDIDGAILQNLTNVIVRRNEDYINDMEDEEEES